ncbi:hypothetical protein ACFSMW_13820 [Virgibacillus halophilus]
MFKQLETSLALVDKKDLPDKGRLVRTITPIASGKNEKFFRLHL